MFEDLFSDMDKEFKSLEDKPGTVAGDEWDTGLGGAVWANPLPDDVWVGEVPDTLWRN